MASVVNHYVASFIIVLLLCRGPPPVFRFVVSVGVNALDLESRLPCWKHIQLEEFVVHPASAHFDSAAPIPRVNGTVRIVTSGFHSCPDVVDRMLNLPRLASGSLIRFLVFSSHRNLPFGGLLAPFGS